MGDMLLGIQWPVLVKYADYEELGVVSDASAWEVEVGPQGAYLNPADILMDAAGVAYSVSNGPEGQKALQPSSQSIELETILSWVRAHASLQGHCCVSKLHATSIAEVFVILTSLDD